MKALPVYSHQDAAGRAVPMLDVFAALIMGGMAQQKPQAPKRVLVDAVVMLARTSKGYAAEIAAAEDCRNVQEAIAMGRLSGHVVMMEVEDGPDVRVYDVECIHDVEVGQ